MGNTIKKIRVTLFVLAIIQIVLAAAFFVFYTNNFFGLPVSIDPLYVVLGSIGVIAIDCLIMIILAFVIANLRKKVDLKAADVIGGDIQEAYNFAKVGLVVTDENDRVIWTNDLFIERHIDIIDENIIEWNKEWSKPLRELKESWNHNGGDITTKITNDAQTYEVKYLPEAGLWIFRDTSDYENTYKHSKEQAIVVGILTIDNYQEIMHGETEDFNDVISKIKNIIFNYCKEYDVLLRKFKDDSYSLLCNWKSLEKMREDRFSLIDKVRHVGYEETTPLTVSIGIATNFEDVNKLNEMAAEAIDIAMSRGGDQVVLNVYGSEIEFVGGKTEAQEKRNKVKTRVIADSLVSLIKQASNVLIMGHTDMDMDALGACLGIKAICDCHSIKTPSRIVVDFNKTEIKTRQALTSSFSKEDLEKIRITSRDASEFANPDTLLIVCDVHVPEKVMAPKLLEDVNKIVVIDHHRRNENYINSPVLNHIDPAASSTCEIIAEFIKFASVNPKVNLPQTYATIMLSGVFLDSQYFKSKHTGIRTFEACTTLKEFGADNSAADDFLKDEREEYFTVNSIVETVKFPTSGVALCIVPESMEIDNATIAKAANACLNIRGVKAAFVIGKVDKKIKISCRSDGTINVQLLAEKLGGGGHFTMAAAVSDKKDIKAAEEDVLRVVSMNINAAKADAKSRKVIELD